MKPPKKESKWSIGLLLLAVILVSCGPEPVEVCETASKPGFWLGLWHGIIMWITFTISLFSDDVTMYAKSNNGAWYDFGFILGAGSSIFGGSKATS